ncbi:type VI secretion system baseplate subunit TssG [Photobacterium profundum]|nr:type VI secretion system baseplate subunit TssG [Photobacterium profundum]
MPPLNVDQLNNHDLYEVVFAIERYLMQTGQTLEIGTDALIDNEKVRFQSSQHLGFSASEVKVTQQQNEKIVLEVSSLGLTGPAGVLPRHYTELVLQRIKKKDYAFKDFLDLFNHRIISLYYKSWEKYQYAVQHQNYLWGKHSDMHEVLKSLTGARYDNDIYWGGLLAKTVRNRSSLEAILSHKLGCSVTVKEFEGRWMPLKDSEQTALSSSLIPEGQHAKLGHSTVLGKRVWDVNAAIKIVIHAADVELTRRLTQKGELLQAIQHITQHFVSSATAISWQVQTAYMHLPTATLKRNTTQLGRSAMLGIRSSLAFQSASISLN